jgi:hypothetical protein
MSIPSPRIFLELLKSNENKLALSEILEALISEMVAGL